MRCVTACQLCNSGFRLFDLQDQCAPLMVGSRAPVCFENNPMVKIRVCGSTLFGLGPAASAIDNALMVRGAMNSCLHHQREPSPSRIGVSLSPGQRVASSARKGRIRPTLGPQSRSRRARLRCRLGVPLPRDPPQGRQRRTRSFASETNLPEKRCFRRSSGRRGLLSQGITLDLAGRRR
jgi:hypothetical protein